jgi:hypothetical protein
MNEKILAWTGLVLCLLGLVRLLLGARWRELLDAFVQKRISKMANAWRWVRLRRQAVREAEKVIRRARQGVTREGNIYKPEAFKRPKKPH